MILKLVFFVPVFHLVTPGVGPVLTPRHDINRLDRGSYGDAYYEISKFYLFQFKTRRILKLVFFGPMFQLVTPGVGPVLTSEASYEKKFDRGLLADATYQISKLYSFQFQTKRTLKLVFFVIMF